MFTKPLVDQRLSLNRGPVVPDITKVGFVEREYRQHGLVDLREPDDDSDGNVGIERVGHAPQLVAGGLSHDAEGCRLDRGFRRQLPQLAKESTEVREPFGGDTALGRAGIELLDIFFERGEETVEAVGPVNARLRYIT